MPLNYDSLLVAFDREPEEAIEFLKSKGIAITWDWKEQLTLIKDHVFTVAKVLSADALETIKGELERAMERGTPYEEWRTRVEDVLQQKGFARRSDGSAWRLDTVYRTNLQSAYMAARDAAMREVAEEFPWWEYVAVVDRRTRPGHMELNGVIRRYDDPFWSNHNPPLGYRCRCRKRSYNDAQMKRIGKKETPNPPTENADKGFGQPPTKPWKPDTSKYSPEIKAALKEGLA